jgi:ribosome-binding factor A
MSRRVLRVDQLIRHELAPIIDRDFQTAGKIVTVMEVDCAPDLRDCTIFVSVLGGTEKEREDVVASLNRRHGAVQRELYKRVKLKSSPRLYFKFDNSAERGVRIVNLIEELPPVTESDAPLAPFKGTDGLDHRWEASQKAPANADSEAEDDGE